MEKIGGYTVLRRLGKGPSTEVFLCRNGETEVALKIFRIRNRRLRKKINKGDVELAERLRLNFIAEGDLISRFNHPHIIAILERTCLADGTPFFVMPYHPRSLAELMGPPEATTTLAADSPLLQRPKRALGQGLTVVILRQLLMALAEVHRQDVVHRDVKPDNVLIDQHGSAVLCDFGVARSPFSDAAPVQRKFGAPPFISPEQSRDPAAVDARTDIYAVGIMAHLMLTGRSPDDRRPPLESNPGIGTGLAKWVMRMTEREAAKRPAAAAAALAQLDDAASGLDLSTGPT
ncbi:MAG TPA: serine/threonine-protein kinase [Alphaproteobacteria bacterium]|nr:serine/threonine-protein kinase [Alphaproteobacteria bacterium]